MCRLTQTQELFSTAALLRAGLLLLRGRAR
jgi:hypothetical protein